MEKKNHPKLPSPQERLDLILLGLARGKSVEKLCQEAGVSRELFYRWMRRVRAGALQALETQMPGPKRVKNVSQAAQKIQRMEERLVRMENRERILRKERDQLTRVNREALRIIHRRAWQEPEAPVKKNGMRTNPRKKSIGRNGSKSERKERRFNPSAPLGEFTVPPTGDGSGGRSGLNKSDEGGLQNP